jgi:hypothetical protein
MEIKVKRNKITPFFKKAEKVIGSNLIADAAGEIGMADQIRTFQTSGSNIGESWAPLAPLTVMLRRKGKGKGRGTKPLLSTSAIPFGMQKVLIRGGVSLRTNKVVGGVDIALVHDEGVDAYPITEKQRRWFAANKIFLPKGWKLEIPARKFSNFSRNAKNEMKDIPKDLKRKLT